MFSLQRKGERKSKAFQDGTAHVDVVTKAEKSVEERMRAKSKGPNIFTPIVS